MRVKTFYILTSSHPMMHLSKCKLQQHTGIEIPNPELTLQIELKYSEAPNCRIPMFMSA